MNQSFLGGLVAVLLLGGAYQLGRIQADDNVLHAQRGPNPPPKPRTNEPKRTKEPLVYGGDGGAAAVSNNGFMAVTGSYGVGTSVLYLMDTNNKQLLVYEARGGSQSMRRLVLVGARRIDLDLELIDYNDESEYKRADLQRLFQGGRKKPKAAGVTVPGDLPTRLGTGEYETTNRGGKSVKKRDGR